LDGWLPGHLAPPDKEGSHRPPRDAEPRAAPLSIRILTTAAARSPSDGRGRDHHDPVLLEGVAIDPADRHGVPTMRDHILDVHGGHGRSFRWGAPGYGLSASGANVAGMWRAAALARLGERQ